MTTTLLLVTRYLFDRGLARARAALSGNPESGALTLEWIVIAGILAAAAVAAGVLFTKSIDNAAKSLP